MSIATVPYPAEFIEVTFLDANRQEFEKGNYKQILPFAVSDIFYAPVKSAKNLTEGSNVKDIVEVCLDIQNTGFNYQPGQTIGIIPENNIDEVNEIIERLEFKEIAFKVFKLSILKNCPKKNAKIPAHIPDICTIYDTLLNYLDIRSVPKKLFLRGLSKYASDSKELHMLQELSLPEGASKYSDFIKNNCVTLLELLKNFKSTFPPFSLLLEHLPKLHPRPYSVSSSPLESGPNNTELKFVYSLEILPNCAKGICSGFLHDKLKKFLENKSDCIESDVKLPIYLRKSNDFKLSDDLTTNIILVAAGTGLAPFIGFLKHREHQIKTNKLSNVGRIVLFFGCRYSDRDFIFKKELNDFLESGVLANLYTCYSREDGDVKYVQQTIKLHAVEVTGMLDASCVVYICGNGKMCKGVSETFTECLSHSSREGLNVLNELKNQKRYIEDVWT